jgi:mannose/fructose/N-acetylgalactosamine-specific phosphotransferase system component IIC
VLIVCSTEAVVAAGASTTLNVVGAVAGNLHSSWWSRTGSKCRVAAEHGHARSILRATEGDHVLANMRRNQLAVMVTAVGQDILNQVVPKLVASNYLLLAFTV